MAAIEKQTEFYFLDDLYKNLTALRNDFMVSEQYTKDYQIKQKFRVSRRALESEINDIKQRIEYLGMKMEPGA